MSESEAMLHEANRRAHRVARLALRRRKALKGNGGESYGKASDEFHRAVDAYEEIEERQQKEATL